MNIGKIIFYTDYCELYIFYEIKFFNFNTYISYKCYAILKYNIIFSDGESDDELASYESGSTFRSDSSKGDVSGVSNLMNHVGTY